MQQTFSDIVGSVFDGAESIDFRQGETDLGEYKFARVTGVDRETVDESISQLGEHRLEATAVESSNGLEVEVWTE